MSTEGQPPLRRISSLPGPRPWPLVGNLLQVRPLSVHRDIERWCQRYGSFFPVYFGRTEVLVVADHEAVAAILRDRPDGFRRPGVTARVSDEMGGLPGVFMAEGGDWRNQRRMVMQGFAPHAIKAYFPALVKVALRLQRRWDGAAQDGREIDLAADLKRYTVDIIAGLAFGTEVNTIDGGEDTIQRHLDDILPAVARRSIALFPYWRYVKLPQDRRLDRSVAAMASAVDELIVQARARMAADPARAARPGNLLEAMIAAADQPGSGVDDRSVAGNVSTMLLAGEDTTANTIAWLLYLLQRHPRAMQAAREEVLRHAPDPAAFSIGQMDALDYLDACIQEAMRLKPVAPFMPLEALRDTAVAGIEVKAGALVWCVLRHHTVSDSHFPRAAEFDPERWLPDAQGAVAADKKVGVPFGAGPRTCPGRYLALLEIKIAMAMVLARYDIAAVQTASGAEAGEIMGFVMSPENLVLRLQRRDLSSR
ncbi:cytochrome P450 [Massilia sp. Root418]|jgi:cytochrome P450|nr:cytochrome P450 [Massilia sp. Root418]